uniref:M48 family metalloprotease n=2 Tax=Natrinema halophilum TaxID=1699371 RepID=A0A7D5GKC3_9EURY
MALVGLLLLLWYFGLAVASYWVLSVLRVSAPDPGVTLLLLLGTAVVGGVLSYRLGTRQLLSRLEAVELPRSHAPAFYRHLDRLESRMDVDSPSVLIARLPMPNAFALGTGRNGVIVLDRSLLRLLSLDELEALVAHELAHLESHDALVQTLAYSIFRTAAGLVFFLFAPLLLPIAGIARSVAWMRGNPQSWSETVFGRLLRVFEGGILVALVVLTLVARAHSRRREYAADERATEVTGNPLALARALRTIERASVPYQGLLATLYVHTEADTLSRLLATHPSTDERIDRLIDREQTDHNEPMRPIE